jgi:hypothetical protein
MKPRNETRRGLTETDVIVARELYRAGHWGVRDLAEKYGVHRNCMSRALYGDTWAHVPGAVLREWKWKP